MSVPPKTVLRTIIRYQIPSFNWAQPAFHRFRPFCSQFFSTISIFNKVHPYFPTSKSHQLVVFVLSFTWFQLSTGQLLGIDTTYWRQSLRLYEIFLRFVKGAGAKDGAWWENHFKHRNGRKIIWFFEFDMCLMTALTVLDCANKIKDNRMKQNICQIWCRSES